MFVITSLCRQQAAAGLTGPALVKLSVPSDPKLPMVPYVEDSLIPVAWPGQCVVALQTVAFSQWYPCRIRSIFIGHDGTRWPRAKLAPRPIKLVVSDPAY